MYKVGDKVRIIGDNCCHGEEIGTIIEIVRIEAFSTYTEFRYSGGINGDAIGNGNYVIERDIEHITRNPIEELFNHFKGLGKPEDIKIIKK
jgi:hypothetical protein